MADATYQTDAAYEELRRRAEQDFRAASAEWQKRILRESGEFPIRQQRMKAVFRARARRIVCEARNEGLKPPPLLPSGEWGESDDPPTKSTNLRINPDGDALDGLVARIDPKIAVACRQFGVAELTAYADLLERKGLAPSQAEAELERRLEETLREIHDRKWALCMGYLAGLFDKNAWESFDETWPFVEGLIREYVRDELHDRIYGCEWARHSEAVVNSGTGDKIRRYREQCGWSQEKLAEKAVISREAISNHENGTSKPTGKILQKYCKAFNENLELRLTPSDLL